MKIVAITKHLNSTKKKTFVSHEEIRMLFVFIVKKKLIFKKMRKISPKVKTELLADPRMKVCARADEGDCDGRITFEHAIIYAGKQLDEAWAILGICEFHHDVNKHQGNGNLNKEKHEWLALRQAPAGRLKELSKAIDYEFRLSYLNKIYG